MFDFLKPNKVNLAVTLDRPLADYYPGDTVQATVSVQAQKDLPIQEARVALLCSERLQVRSEENEKDSSGANQTTINTAWQTINEEFAQETLAGAGTIAGGQPLTYQFTARIPPDARPSWQGGGIVERTWLVKATLDRRLATDVNAEAPLVVAAVAPGLLASAGAYGRSNNQGDVQLSFALPGKEYVTGDTISGQLQIDPIKDSDINEVRVELVRVESVPEEAGNTYNDSTVTRLAGKTSLQRGKSVQIPFSITIAAPRPTSGRTARCSVTWLLRGILSRGLLRSDYVIEEELSVYSARRPAAAG